MADPKKQANSELQNTAAAIARGEMKLSEHITPEEYSKVRAHLADSVDKYSPFFDKVTTKKEGYRGWLFGQTETTYTFNQQAQKADFDKLSENSKTLLSTYQDALKKDDGSPMDLPEMKVAIDKLINTPPQYDKYLQIANTEIANNLDDKMREAKKAAMSTAPEIAKSTEAVVSHGLTSVPAMPKSNQTGRQ